MLQSWLAKPFQNRNQGSLWPSQKGNGTLKRMLDFLFPCWPSQPSLVMPRILALQVCSSSPHQIHFSIGNLGSRHNLDQNLSVPSHCWLPSWAHRGPGPEVSFSLLPLGCRPGSFVFHPCSLSGSWAFLCASRSKCSSTIIRFYAPTFPTPPFPLLGLSPAPGVTCPVLPTMRFLFHQCVPLNQSALSFTWQLVLNFSL